MDSWMDEMNVCMDGLMDGWNEWMNGRLGE